MSKIKLLLTVLTAILLAGNAQGGFGGRGGGGGGRGGRAESTVAVFPEVAPDGTVSQEVVNELVATVRSADAADWEKRDALRQLQLAGNEATVPVIASLLGDPNFSHMARYALQNMPYANVDTAFRNALSKVNGLQLAGVIHSIGIRGDTEAVPQLATLLSNSDTQVAHEAAIALGAIGNDAAARALRGAVANAQGDKLYAVCEGLFRCAESLGGNTAIDIYDQVRKMDTNSGVRTAAIRGAILARGNNGVQVLKEYLSGGEDYPGFVSAVRTSQEMKAAGTTEALTGAMSGLSADNQILIIWTLGKRGDTAAVPALLSMIRNEGTDKSVRVEAIKILPQLPDTSSLSVLMGLMADSDSDIAAAAQTAVATMPGQAIDRAVIAMLNSNEADQRLAAIDMIGRRRITSSIPQLVNIAISDDNPQIRQASLRQIGQLGTLDNLDSLLDLALNLKDPADMDAAIDAISTVFTGAENPQAYAQPLINRLGQAQPTQKSALLRVLSVVGGSEALTAVRAAVNDSNTEVSNAAIQSLSDWPDFEAVQMLFDLAANNTTSLANSVLSLRGVARLIRESTDAPLDDRVKYSLASYNIARRDEERRELISVMSTLRSIDVGNKLVEIATENEALRSEAGLAAIQVATSLYTGQVAGGARGRGGMFGGAGGGRGGAGAGGRGGAAGGRGGAAGGRGARGNSASIVSPNSSLIISSIAPLFATAAGGRGGAGGGRGGMGGMGGFGGFGGRGQTVTVTDKEREAAIAIAKAILALNISEQVNTTAQSIIDGTITANTGRGGRGNFGGMPGGARGGMPGGAGGAAGGRGGAAGGGRGGAAGGRGQ